MTPSSRVKWVEELIYEASKNDEAELEHRKDIIQTTLARRHKKARIDESSTTSKSENVGDVNGSGDHISPGDRRPPGTSFSRKKEGVPKNNQTVDVVGRECLDTSHHWHFLLKEMMWMAEDFSKERKRHASLAKKQSKSIEAHVKGHSARKAKSQKDSILALHRIAQRSAREIRSFWGKLQRFVAYKQKRLCDETRQKAMDRHLVYLMKQTEMYTKSLSSHHRSLGDSLIPTLDLNQNENQSKNQTRNENSNGFAPSTQGTNGNGDSDENCGRSISNDGSVIDLNGQMMSDGTNSSQESFEFQEKPDNETTIDYDEMLMGGAQDTEEEILALKLEAELSVEELLKQYGYIGEEDKESVLKDKDEAETGSSAEERRNDDLSDYYAVMEESDSDGEFIATEQADDEETIAVEEKLAKPYSYSQELSALQSEAETPLDYILCAYGYSNSNRLEDSTVVDTGGSSSGGVATGPLPSSITNSLPCPMVMVNRDDEGGYSSSGSISSQAEGSSVSDNDSDFVAYDEADDERTLEEAERLEGQYNASDEIKSLTLDSEIPLEDILKMYRYDSNNADGDHGSSDDSRNEVEHTTPSPPTISGSTSKESTSFSGGGGSGSGDTMSGASVDECVNADDPLHRLEAMDEKARSINILRPFLLSKSVKLREYQHSGLNWLASLHERRLNGILADEMGLGKTLQTISLFAYLACYKGIWGPHLIVVPTSCMVNWEIEFKRFCPAFKVLTYYGSAKTRRDLRAGWTKPSSFHVCITSYQLAVVDATSFKRKKWYFLVLDEAHNIKNFKSQRWQTLLTFPSQRRLLLTGTPLQNSLMELWSLMHFLMPHIFRR